MKKAKTAKSVTSEAAPTRAIAAAPGQIGLAHAGPMPAKLFDSPRLPASVRPLFKGAKNVHVFAEDLACGWFRSSPGQVALGIYTARKGLFLTSVVTKKAGRRAVLTPDRAHLVVTASGDRDLWRVDLARGEAHQLWSLHTEAERGGDAIDFSILVALAKGEVVVFDWHETMWWLAPERGALRVVATLRVNANDLHGTAVDGGGQVLVMGSPLGPFVLARDGSSVRALASFPDAPTRVTEGSPSQASIVDLGAEQLYRLEGVEDALARVQEFPVAADVLHAAELRRAQSKPAPGGFTVAPTASTVGFVLAGERKPHPPWLPAAAIEAFVDDRTPGSLPDALVHGWIPEGRRKFRFGTFAHGALLPTSLVASEASSGPASFSADRTQVVLCLDNESLHLVDLTTGAARQIFAPDDDSIQDVALLEGGHVAVCARKALLVLSPDAAGTYAVSSRLSGHEFKVRPDAQGRVLVVHRYKAPNLAVYAPDGAVMRLLGELDVNPAGIFSVERDALRFQMSDGGIYRLDGLDAALARLASFPVASA